MARRVTIIKIRKSEGSNVNQELQWLGNSLGLFNLRDKDSSCFRLFITLVRTSKQRRPLTSDEIAQHLKLSRGTVIHHLAKLMDAGIAVKEHKGYILREESLKDVVKDLHRDTEAVFAELEEVAKEIDERLG
ncbi:MAG TPA: helix-turn-helix domain-containing protein [Candidatus Nanoarchaeia archaeon]|nr:helix-turn-helix domain-containing protein [Candidatus Nanoarchaeia archaeon]